jgi:hypothetical protein
VSNTNAYGYSNQHANRHADEDAN